MRRWANAMRVHAAEAKSYAVALVLLYAPGAVAALGHLFDISPNWPLRVLSWGFITSGILVLANHLRRTRSWWCSAALVVTLVYAASLFVVAPVINDRESLVTNAAMAHLPEEAFIWIMVIAVGAWWHPAMWIAIAALNDVERAAKRAGAL